MKIRALLLASLVLLITACEARPDRPGPTASQVSTPIASPTVAVPTPRGPYDISGMRAWNIPPNTGVGHLDELIAAMTSGDVTALAARIERGLLASPCVLADWPALCAPGMAEGTLTRSIAQFGGNSCEGGFHRTMNRPSDIVRLAEQWTRPVTSLAYVTRSNTAADTYRLVFLNVRDGSSESGWMLRVSGEQFQSFSELESFVVLCGHRNLTQVMKYLDDSTVLVPPPP